MHPILIPARASRLTPLAAALAFALGSGAAVAGAAAPSAPASEAIAAQRYALRLHARQARAADPQASSHDAGPAPRGATLPVTSCADDDAPGTLRNVLASASEGDVVDLSALTCSTITLTQGPIDTSALGEHQLYDVTLQGPGRDALTIEAAEQSQVFVVGGFSSSLGRFTANDLTIANGRYGGSLAACILGFGGAVALNRVDVRNCHSSGTYQLVFGGAVDVNRLEMTDSSITDSSLTATGTRSTGAGGGAYTSDGAILINSTISGNTVTAPYASREGYATVGGGLYSRGKLVLIDSTISGNSIEATNAGQDAQGGGVYVRGVASISGSTIAGNRADGDGGGVFKAVFSVYGDPPPPQDTHLTVTNSTFSGNSAARGGAIATARPLRLSNSTVAFNAASAGGGGVMFRLADLYDSEGVLDAQSSIIARNEAGDGATFAADLASDGALAMTGANNLIVAADAAITLPVDTLALDPLLLPLADNGGPTRTHALAVDSPAIDAGNNVAQLEADQRGAGFARVAGAAADIGAFERQQADDDTIFKDGFDGVPEA